MEIEEPKAKACTCNYCVDQFLDFDNTGTPCPNYQAPKIEHATSIANQSCPICYSSQVLLFPNRRCGHSFCFKCILTWEAEAKKFAKKATCPLCRGKFY